MPPIREKFHGVFSKKEKPKEKTQKQEQKIEKIQEEPKLEKPKSPESKVAEGLRKIDVAVMRRQDALLICDNPEIIEEAKKHIKAIGRTEFEEIEANSMLTWDFDKMRGEVNSKNFFVMNVDLDNKEYQQPLACMRSHCQKMQQVEDDLSGKKLHYLFIKPHTTHQVPSWHPCFNWTSNIQIE